MTKHTPKLELAHERSIATKNTPKLVAIIMS